MKKLIVAAVMALMVATPARADMTQDLNDAFAKQDFAALESAIAKNPGQEGAMGAAISRKVGELISTNPELAAQYMGKVGTLCTANMDQQSAGDFAQALRGLMAALRAAEGNTDANNQVLAAAVGCAGQPAIVAEDPSLYLSMLADASESANEDVVQFARQQFIPRLGPLANNQQPTITLSPEF